MTKKNNSQNTDINTKEEKAPDTQPPFTIQIQYVKDFSFENPNAPLIYTVGHIDPEINVKIDVTVQQLHKTDFEVSVHIDINAKKGDQQAYLIELVYSGIVRIGNIPQEMLQPLLFVETPRMLFPYARQILSNAVIEGGFPQLILTPFDFMTLFKERIIQAQNASKNNENNIAN